MLLWSHGREAHVSHESRLQIGQKLRYGLVVRIPGSHPGGPGSIPGNGKLFEEISLLENTFEFLYATVALQTNRNAEQNIASAGNRTRINCLEGSYADHYTTDALLTFVLPKARVFQ